MNILCRLGQHKPLPSKLWNDGHYFTACARCKRMLIRTPAGRWSHVPAHLRVVWRERTDDDVVWPQHLL